MNPSAYPLFNDPAEAIRLGATPGSWEGLSVDDLEAVIFHSLLRYGSSGNMGMIDSLYELYQRYRRAAAPERRLRLAGSITQLLIAGDRGPDWLALLGLAMCDDDNHVVSTASLDIAMLHPAEAGDPLTGPRQVLKLLAGGIRHQCGFERRCNEGAAFAGVLLTGDRRLSSDLRAAWQWLSPPDRLTASQQRSGLATGLLADFWIERLAETADAVLFTSIAKLIAEMPNAAARHSLHQGVVEVTRHFDFRAGKVGMTVDKETPFAIYLERHREGLAKISERGPDPKAVFSIINAWGQKS
jgi:hypothetical protein